MALKFADLEKYAAPSRVIDSIKDAVIKYDGLSVPVKLISLEGGVNGMVSLDRFADFRKTITGDANGNMVLPEKWKIGKAKNGLAHGYFYNSEEFSGGGNAELELLS